MKSNDTGMMDGWPDLAKHYFDFEAFARDLELGGDIVKHNGHVFNTYW